MLIVAHSVAGTPYPFARIVIYCRPVLAFTMCLLIERFRNGKVIARSFLHAASSVLSCDDGPIRAAIRSRSLEPATISSLMSLMRQKGFQRDIGRFGAIRFQERSLPCHGRVLKDAACSGRRSCGRYFPVGALFHDLPPIFSRFSHHLPHSSRMSLEGSTASARVAGMADAAMPSSAIVSTAPPTTAGSPGFA